MSISRREFLKLIAISAVIAAAPAFSSNRKPYVNKGEIVNYIGIRGKGTQSFIGGRAVKNVYEFDGVGYPVDVHNNSYGVHAALERYYDFDLVDFNRELPEHFWWNKENGKKYPNVHTYIREQRFGETVLEAIEYMKPRIDIS
jgi:hypothetical protein